MVASVSVIVDCAGPVWTITIDRAESRNAIDLEAANHLRAAFLDFDADPDASVAVLTGANDTFCSGADLKAMGTSRENRLRHDGAAPLGVSRLSMSKPVIAAVEGHAVAGGLELALWCDLRVAAEDAVFGVFCRRWGVPLIDGGTVRLPRLIGQSRAMDMILTGRAVNAREGQQMGLVNRVVPTGEARARAEALAHQLAQFPQTTMRHDRLSVIEQAGHNEADAMKVEWELGMQSLHAHAREGAQRFSDGAGRHGSFDA